MAHGSGVWAHSPLPRLWSGGAAGLRASQLRHAVEAWTPTSTSVARHPPVRERSPSPTTHLQRDAAPARLRPWRRAPRLRRGHDDVRLGAALGHVGVNAPRAVRAVAGDGSHQARDLVEQGSELGGVVHLAVGVAATIRSVSAGTAGCVLRQGQRLFAPHFSTNHSPGPRSFSPVLSTKRCMGPASSPTLPPSGWTGRAVRSRPSLVFTCW